MLLTPTRTFRLLQAHIDDLYRRKVVETIKALDPFYADRWEDDGGPPQPLDNPE